MLNIGDKVGRFEVLGELGRGAMGVVMRASDPHLGREVAIKLLSRELSADEEMVARFSDEARNASRLIHPNIATVFEAGPSPAGWYVAFELVDGETLKSLMAKGSMSISQTRNYLLQIAEGLSCAHAAGIVHRDLKPENIIVTPTDTVKITDFGLAKRLGSPGRTRVGTILGTASYMSPEQALAADVDARADWFSLGVISFEMLTGKLPFDGAHEMAVMYSVIHEEPTPVTELRSDAPQEMALVISQMMQKDPQKRLASLADLKEKLSTVAVTQETSAPSSSKVREVIKSRVAVLPLENRSANTELDYLAGGFAEDIAAALGLSDRFDVTDYEQVLSTRPEDGSRAEWGKRLNVNYLLYGSLYQAGGRFKLRLNLQDYEQDRLIWTESFTGSQDEVFELQDSVASKVAETLGQTSLGDVETRRGTRNPEAYDFYMRGREYYRREGKENLEFAIDMFDRALEIDAGFAPGLAAQADAYAQMYIMYYDRDRKWLRRAENSAKAALIKDPNLAEAHRALGRVMMEYGRNDEAIRAFEEAISKRPDFHEAYRTLGWIYQGMGRYTDSIAWGTKSLKIKPMDRETYLLLGLNHLDLREWDKAKHYFERAVKISPDYGRAYMHLGNVAQKTGDLTGAINLYRKALKHLTDITAYIDLGWAQVLSGDFDEARSSFQALIEAGDLEFVAFYHLGIIDLQQSHTEKAAARFETAMSVCRKQLTNDPENVYALMVLAQCQAQLCMSEEALQSAKRGMATDPGNGELSLQLAKVYAIMGDRKNTITALQLALQQPMGPSFFEIQHDPHFLSMDLSVLEAATVSG